MIRNPYLKKSPKKKRQERPWEATNPQSYSTTATADDDGGDSIDWDEASRIVDKMTSQLVPHQNQHHLPNYKDCSTRTCSQNIPTQPSWGANYSTNSSKSFAATSAAAAVKLPLPDTGTTTTPTTTSGASLAVVAAVQQAPSKICDPITQQHKQNQQAVASLRPDSWNNNKSSTNSQNRPSVADAVAHYSRSSAVPPTMLPTTTVTKTLQPVPPTNKCSDPRQQSLPAVLQFNPATVKPVEDDYRKRLVQHANLSVTLENGWVLYSHQKKAILRGLLMRRMILALDMGLGKTLIGCVWAKAFCKTFIDITVFVICPVSLKKEWKRTAEAATGLVVAPEEGSKKRSVGDDGASPPNVVIASWAKIPKQQQQSGHHQYVVVADEAHSMQSMQAARTRDALQLMLHENCIGVLLLSGTPMKNGRPSNLFPLLRAVKHPLGKHQRAYEAYFCEGREVYFGSGSTRWQANGSANLEQLRELTKSHILYLTKEECLADALPTQKRIIHKVPVSSRRQIQHTEALRDLSRLFAAKRQNNDAILGAVQKLRMIGSLAKMDATVELALQILQQEAAIVIFTSFQQVARTVHEQLGQAGWKGELLTGETPPKKRQDIVDSFQNGLSPVFVCTFGAGGVGLTLTAASTVILLDRPWTPGETHQAEDRVRRIGQKKEQVQSIWVSAFDLDEQIDQLLEQKNQTSQAVLSSKKNDQTADKQSSAAPLTESKLSVFQMLQKVLPKASRDSLMQTSMLQFSQEAASTYPN